MTCDQTIRVSELIDGELGEKEGEELRAHIEGCSVCAAAREEFLLLRLRIKGLTIDERTASPHQTGFLKQKIVLPLPAFAATILVITIVISGLFFFRPVPSATTVDARRPKMVSRGGASLARFDRGGKARIYKEVKR